MGRKRVKVEADEEKEGEGSSNNGVKKEQDNDDDETEDIKPSRASKRRKLDAADLDAGPSSSIASTSNLRVPKSGGGKGKGKGRETAAPSSSSQSQSQATRASTRNSGRGTSTLSSSPQGQRQGRAVRQTQASTRQRRSAQALSSVTNRDVKPDVRKIKQEEEGMDENDEEDNNSNDVAQGDEAMDDEVINNTSDRVKKEPESSPPPVPRSAGPSTNAATADTASPPSTSTLRPDRESTNTHEEDAQDDEEEDMQLEVENENSDNRSGTSTLSALSEEGGTVPALLSAPRDGRRVKLEPKVDNPAITSDKENDEPEVTQDKGKGKKKKLTKKDKGKQRAANQDNPGEEEEDGTGEGGHNAQHVKKMEEELRKLRAELENKTATLESQTNAMNRVTEAFTCNVCLEALRNPLALACGHIFCQDDLWNWFHRTDADSDDEGDFSSSSDDDSSGESDDETPPAHVIPSVPAGRPGSARRPLSRRDERPRTRRNHQQGDDLFDVSDDYNTDDPLSEFDSGPETGEVQADPPTTRFRARISAIAAGNRLGGSAPRVLATRAARKGTTTRWGPGRIQAGRVRSTDDSASSASEAERERGAVDEGVPPVAMATARPYSGPSTAVEARSTGRVARKTTGPAQVAQDRSPETAGAAPTAMAARSSPQTFENNARIEAGPSDCRAGGTARKVTTTRYGNGQVRRYGVAAAAAGPSAAAVADADSTNAAAPVNSAQTQAAADATSAAAAAPRRIPARRHPNKKNLVCPQCRTRVSIPPFPIFMIRELNDLVNVHAHGRRVGSVEREREADGMVEDVTWGGLFPRAAAAGTHAGRSAVHGDVPIAPWRQASLERARMQHHGVRPPPQPDRAGRLARRRGPMDDSDEEDVPVTNNAAARPSRPHGPGIREQSRDSESDEGMEEILRYSRDYAANVAAGRDGQARREEAEHEAVVGRMRHRELDWLERNAANRRRALRLERMRGRPSGPEDRENETRLRAAEDTAIDNLRRELAEERRNRPRNLANAPGPRRDVLRRGIWDAEDRVRRCVDCNWEIERGSCQHCGVTYDSDSEFDEDAEDDTVAATTSPGREHAWPGDSQVDDIIDDEDASVKAESEGDYAMDPSSDRIKRESGDEGEDETDDDQLARSLFPVRARPAGRRLHPFSSEEPVEEDRREGSMPDEEEEEEEEGEDLVHDHFDDGDEEKEDRKVKRESSRDDEDEDEDEEEDVKPSRRAREAAAAKRQTKKSRFMYDSNEEEDEEMEDEDDDGFFVNDSRVKEEEEEEGERDILDDESEAESTDRETKRARREQRKQARQAQSLTRGGGVKQESTSDFSGEDSESSEEEDEEEEEEESAPTSHTSPAGVKKEEEDEDEDMPTISSQNVRQEIRHQLARHEGISTAGNNAARAAIARNSRQPVSAQQTAMEAYFNDRVNQATREAQQRLTRAGPAQAGPSRLAIQDSAPATSKRRRVIEESSDEDE